MEDFYKLPMYSSEFSDIPSNPFTITAQNYFEPPLGGGLNPRSTNSVGYCELRTKDNIGEASLPKIYLGKIQ